MFRFLIDAIAIVLSIVITACSDDSTNTPEYSSPSGYIEIIELPDISSSSKNSLDFFHSKKTDLFFSNKIEIKESSSSDMISSSSKTKNSSSSSKIDKKSSSSSNSKSSSSSIQNNSSSSKANTPLRFYNCDKYNCVTMENLNFDISYGEMLDTRDNKVYRTIVISNHVWTAQNMNFAIETDSISKSWCLDNDDSNCEKYGKLYNWEAATKVCPEGWHLPTRDEWFELLEEHSSIIEYSEDEGTLSFRNAGNYLKSANTWNDTLANNDSLGFSVIAAGIAFNEETSALGETTCFWSATDFRTLYAYATLFMSDEDSVIYGATEKTRGFSVRCIKGQNE